MRKLPVMLAASLALVAMPGISRAGTQALKDVLIHIDTGSTANPNLTGPFSAAFSNTTSKGTTVGDNKCGISFSMKPLTGIPDTTGTTGSDALICESEGDSNLGGHNTFIFRVPVKLGAAKFKTNLKTICNIPCGTSGVEAFNQRTTCYAPDASFAPTLALSCAKNSDCTGSKAPAPCCTGAGTGKCLLPGSGVVLGAPPARPASGLVTTQGLFFP